MTVAPPKPAHDELEALIEEARERQARRRILGAAAIAVATALGLAIYGLMSAGNPRSLAGGAPDGAPPLCRSSQLSVSTAGFAGIEPITGGGRLVNHSLGACSLAHGWPSVRIVWRGRVLPAEVRKGYGIDDGPGKLVHVLQPGGSAEVSLVWENWCGRPRLPGGIRPTFELRFPDGLDVPLQPGSTPPPACVSPGRPALVFVTRPYAAADD